MLLFACYTLPSHCIPCVKLHTGITPAGNFAEMLAGYDAAVSLLRRSHITMANRFVGSRTRTVLVTVKQHHCHSPAVLCRAMGGAGDLAV